MGYVSITLSKILEFLEKHFGKFKGLRMLELGDQKVWDYSQNFPLFLKYKYETSSPYTKKFFEHLGFLHTSIDYSGLNGSIKIDLRDNLPKKINLKFDVVTNLGTTEHVGEDDSHENIILNQYKVFKNLHEVGDIGCVYYHVVPLTKNWHKHGACDYSKEFFNELCKKCGYKILVPVFEEKYRKEKNRILISMIYEKTKNNNFLSLEEFSKIKGIRTTFFD